MKPSTSYPYRALRYLIRLLEHLGYGPAAAAVAVSLLATLWRQVPEAPENERSGPDKPFPGQIAADAAECPTSTPAKRLGGNPA